MHIHVGLHDFMPAVIMLDYYLVTLHGVRLAPLLDARQRLLFSNAPIKWYMLLLAGVSGERCRPIFIHGQTPYGGDGGGGGGWVGWGVNQAYSRLSTTHGHITDCKLDSVVYAGVCV